MKRKVSVVLILTMVFTMIVNTSSAFNLAEKFSSTSNVMDMNSAEYQEMIEAGLISPDFLEAYANEDVSKLSPPPGLVLQKGEVWVPGAINPNSISLLGEDDECKHHGQPKNYRYIGAVKGNTSFDVTAIDILTGTIFFFAPAPFNIALVAASVYDLATSLTKGDTLQGSYMKWQYIYNVGPDPNMYWFHTFFYATTDRNAKLALGCQATYSPPKPGDQYQD